MKATLLTSTPNATKLVATAAWICTHADFPTEADLHPDKCGPLVRRVIGYGCWVAGKHISYSLMYEDMVQQMIKEMVRPEALR